MPIFCLGQTLNKLGIIDFVYEIFLY
jgi:hypothetical protein